MDPYAELGRTLTAVNQSVDPLAKRDFHSLTHEDLTDLRDVLNASAENVQTIRDHLFK